MRSTPRKVILLVQSDTNIIGHPEHNVACTLSKGNPKLRDVIVR